MSGQVGQDPATGKLVAGGVEAEARQIFRNAATLLDAAGKAFGDVVRAGVFLTDIGDFAAVNAIYAAHFDAAVPGADDGRGGGASARRGDRDRTLSVEG